MRQVTRQSVLFFSILLCVALPASAIDDGSVHFQGQVVNTGCSVSAESQDQIVRMGQIRNNEFAATGDWAAPTAFQITLEDCDTSVSQRAGVLFSGESDAKDPQIFRAGYGAGAAQGIGVGIFDATGHLLIPDTAPPWYAPLQNGANVLRFMAKYRSTQPHVQAGTADAQVWFNVVYQ